MAGLVIAVLGVLALEFALWRWGVDSRHGDERDRFWWPNG